MSKKGKKITLKIKYIRRNTCYLSLLILSSIHPYVLIGIGSIHIPTTLFDALNKIEWKNTMKEEIKAVIKNETRRWWNYLERKNLWGINYNYCQVQSRWVTKEYTQKF